MCGPIFPVEGALLRIILGHTQPYSLEGRSNAASGYQSAVSSFFILL